MSKINGARAPYMLSVTPVDFSLTAGTDIPAPADSPVEPSKDSTWPPPPRGGPLTSHPTTPDDDSKFFSTDRNQANGQNGATFPVLSSPTSQMSSSDTIQSRRPSGVRRLLSLSSLRNSFSSSRTSLVAPTQTSSNTTTSQRNSSLDRPCSPSIASTHNSSFQSTQTSAHSLRKKRSSRWFGRKSISGTNGDSLEVVTEQPENRESKRLRETKSAAFLPDVSALRGGTLNDGAIGWDEKTFKR